MNYLYRWFLIFALTISSVSLASAQSQPAAEQLFTLANQSRAQAGLPPLTWDPALVTAAMKHCERMSVEGPLEHQYPGELDLSERASLSGVHFSLIAENIALGQNPAQIHNEWMHSQGHRENLLSAQVDHIGIAVIARRGNLYAVEDFARNIRAYSPQEAEAQVASLIHASGIRIRPDPADARRACLSDHGLPSRLTGGEPTYDIRWQSADLDHLPPSLQAQLRSGQYQQAAVGSCAARDVQAGFTQYRLAVLLY
jgi:Cysteine-rich secretory protein family